MQMPQQDKRSRIYLSLAFLLLLSGLARAAVERVVQEEVSASVLKVRATRTDGSVSLGSAVVIDTGKAITNCHVLRYAREIKLMHGDGALPAHVGAHDVEHDLCVLIAEGLAATPARVGSTEELAAGADVVAVGFPGGSFALNEGKVRALHEFSNGRIVQTSACFSPGASGGGLFDAQGRLVGILTFKGTSGGDYHFVLPVEWVKELADAPASTAGPRSGRAFWEQEPAQQPFFLQAAALEERSNWDGLMRLAKKWSDAEAARSDAWLAMGRACSKLKRQREAAAAFQKVIEIDPAHKEGWQALQGTMRDLSTAPVCKRYAWCQPLELVTEPGPTATR
jgi:serine protease Do